MAIIHCFTAHMPCIHIRQKTLKVFLPCCWKCCWYYPANSWCVFNCSIWYDYVCDCVTDNDL